MSCSSKLAACWTEQRNKQLTFGTYLVLGQNVTGFFSKIKKITMDSARLLTGLSVRNRNSGNEQWRKKLTWIRNNYDSNFG